MILRKGNRGSQVAELQRLLRIKDDGIFGSNTDRVVREFQRNNRLTIDGIVGPRTWTMLLANTKVNIVPLYTQTTQEDFSDPEEEMKVSVVKEEAPTCKNITELISLINSSNITRNITRLVFHCTATAPNASVTAIQRHWREVLKWNNPGYHIIIKSDGSWTQLANFNNTVNGVAGINSNSLHISYIGGIDPRGRAIDNRTTEQNNILETIYLSFREKLPRLTFHGHNEFSNKACPSFNVKNWIDSVNKKV